MRRYERSSTKLHYMWLLLPCWCLTTNIGAVLHSGFLQPGNGVMKETWYNAHEMMLDSYIELETYPTCPDLVENLDDFNDPPKYEDPKLKYILVRYKSYFIPPESGNYRFYIKCKEKCSLRIEEKPSELRTITEATIKTSSSCWDCDAIQTSSAIFLYKSVRYYIEALRVGEGKYDFFGLGVQMPSGLKEKPITKSKLQRTLSLYGWHGMLAEYYNIANGTTPDFNNMTSGPTEVRCMKETMENRRRNNFAIRATGYFQPQNSGFYRVYLQCQDYCMFYFLVNGTERTIAQSGNGTIGDIGRLMKGEQYLVRIEFYNDYKGVAAFSVKRASSGNYSFFASAETRAILTEVEVVPDPTYTVINSTSIIMHWNQTKIPVYNNFNFSSYYIRFWPSDNQSHIYEHTITNQLTTWAVLANLGVWKTYQAQLCHVGKQYKLISKLLIFRTGQGAPSAPPSMVYLAKHTSTSIVVRWGSIPTRKRNGILTGYAIKYKKKDENVWFDVLSNTATVRQKVVTGLVQYTVYDFRVAGMTSGGIGKYSPIYHERTSEDAPTAAPVGVSAYNRSSTTLEVTWGKVPFEDRNGIIRKYVIYYKLKSAQEKDWTFKEESGSVNTSLVIGLKHWSFYEVKVAAKTIKEGNKSEAVLARTDEYVPSWSPLNVTGKASSSKSIAMKWTQIPYEHANGIITGYMINYKETEANTRWLSNFTTEMFITITGLQEYFIYTFRVAGMTKKGVGKFSTDIYVRTDEDVPSAPPDGIEARNTSTNSLLVLWKKVPHRHQNGIITGYQLKYRENQTSRWHELIINDTHQQREISSPKNYTWYEISVAGMTKIGVGEYSEPIQVLTDENVPSASPTNFKGNNLTSHSIIVYWNSIPLKWQNGIIIGYRVQFRDASVNGSVWMETTFNRTANNGTIFNLLVFQPYYIRIAGITIKGVGIFSKEIKVWTEEDFPIGYPTGISGVANSSTSLFLQWDHRGTKYVNGILLGYMVYYQIVKCPEDRTLWCSESEIFKARTKNNENHITLKELKKFMEYNVWIKILNKIGAGPPSPKVKMQTASDIPTAKPELVEAFSNDYTSISVFWNPIRESMRNGIIIMYRIFYRLQEAEVFKTQRVGRSIITQNNRTASGRQSGESYFNVNGSLTSATIYNLKPFRWYIVRIGGVTKAGLGPVAVLNASCGQGVAVAAPQLRVDGGYSLFEISLSWTKLQSFTESQGTVLEYNVQYWPIDIEMKPSMEYSIMSVTVKAPKRSTKLVNLRPFTKYGIRMAAATQTGVGKYTNIHYGETCRCNRTIKILKKILFPLITTQANDAFTKLVDSGIRTCCSTCAGTNTTTYWTTDKTEEGILTAQDLIEQLKLGQEIFAPQLQLIHALDTLERSYGRGYFIPVLKSPGIAVISKVQTPVDMGKEGARFLLEGLLRAYPILIISFIVLILSGFLQWLNELNESKSHFNNSIKHGLPQAIWFSFVTTSGVGYGDMVPSKMLIGRLLATASMFLGIIWKALLCSIITVTCLTYLQKYDRVFTLARKKVVVTNQTQLLALKKGATIVKVFNYNQQFEATKSVLSGEAELALVDGLSLINDGRIASNPHLEMKELIDYNQYYGIVVSGETERLGNCINIYMRNNWERVQGTVESQHGSLWNMMQKKSNLGKSSTIISKDAKIFKNMIIALLSMLIFAIIVGLLHELRQRKRQRMRIDSEDLAMLLSKDESLVTMVDEFVDKITRVTEDLDVMHAKQIIALSDKKYAINIVPDIIAMYGNADYEKDIEEFKKSMGLCLASESDVKFDNMNEEIKMNRMNEGKSMNDVPRETSPRQISTSY